MTEVLHVPIPLRWGDLDAYDHVNNASMIKILEEARVRALWKPGPGEDAPTTAVMDSGIATGVLTLIARHEIEYLAPAPYQQHPLDVRLWFGHIGGADADVCYEVCSPLATAGSAPQTVYARANTLIVKVDARTGLPMRISPAERAAWTPYLGEPVRFSRKR